MNPAYLLPFPYMTHSYIYLRLSARRSTQDLYLLKLTLSGHLL